MGQLNEAWESRMVKSTRMPPASRMIAVLRREGSSRWGTWEGTLIIGPDSPGRVPHYSHLAMIFGPWCEALQETSLLRETLQVTSLQITRAKTAPPVETLLATSPEKRVLRCAQHDNSKGS